MPKGYEYSVRKFDKPTDYGDILRLQEEINLGVRQGSMPETILEVEHLPVFTLGVHGDACNMLAGEEELRKRGARLIRTGRGGDITYHGPGQLVVYPIVNLAARPYGVKEYVRRIEESVIRTCGDYGIGTFRLENAPGVWCKGKNGPAKICALGIKVRHGVTMHGLALNITTDLSWFTLINPCGFHNGSVTSMKEMMAPRQVPAFDDVAQTIAINLKNLL